MNKSKSNIVFKCQPQFSISSVLQLFQPLSETCTGLPNGMYGLWPVKSTQVLKIPLMSFIVPRPSFVPPAIPSDLAERLFNFHGQPSIWWTSQLTHFIFTPKPETEKMFEEVQSNIKTQIKKS